MYVKRGKNEKRCPESNPQSIYKNPQKKKPKKKTEDTTKCKGEARLIQWVSVRHLVTLSEVPFLLFCIEEVLWCRGICIHFLYISYPLSSKRKMCPDRRQHRRKPLMYWLRLPYTVDAAGAPPAKPPRITLHHPAPPGNTLHHLAPLIAPVRSAFRPATLKFQLLRQNDKWTCSRKFLLCLLSRPTRPASSLCCHFLHSSNQKPLRRQPTKCVGVAETAAWADMCVL